MKYEEKISNRLNELIEKNMNAKDGYSKATDIVENDTIKNFFNDRAVERARFVKELRSEVWDNNEIPNNSGTVTGEIHRSWMSLKSAFSSNDEEAMLEETIRGEKASLEEYNEILSETTLPSSTMTMLSEQRNAIKSAIKRAESFETSFA